MKDHSIFVYQARYATYIFAKYLDTYTVKASTQFYKTALTSDMIFTKSDASTSYEQVEKLTREFNIHYRACIGSLVYLLSTRVELLENGFGYFSKDIPCELLRICTLVHVNQNLSDEGSFHLCGSG